MKMCFPIPPLLIIMNKNNKTAQFIAIAIIAASVLVSGYLILKPNSQAGGQNQDTSSLAPMVDGKQVIKMTVKSVSYDPNYFKVKAGIPVRWEITSSGQPGCAAGALISNGLLDGPIYLNPNQGEITVKEFTPQNAGTYRFNCPMNMARGTIEVVN